MGGKVCFGEKPEEPAELENVAPPDPAPTLPTQGVGPNRPPARIQKNSQVWVDNPLNFIFQHLVNDVSIFVIK
jgi:hypothetical protein